MLRDHLGPGPFAIPQPQTLVSQSHVVLPAGCSRGCQGACWPSQRSRAIFPERQVGKPRANPRAGCRVLQGDHLVGKYRCLLCPKEFSSESGVKYHILKAHAEVGGAACARGRGALCLAVGVGGLFEGEVNEERPGLSRFSSERLQLPEGRAARCPPSRGLYGCFSLPRTGSALRQTRRPNTGARNRWPPGRRRRVWQAGRSGAAGPRSSSLKSLRPRCPPARRTGPREAETRGPGAPLAGRWEPASPPRSEHSGWQGPAPCWPSPPLSGVG